MAMAEWFEMVVPSGGTRFELLDTDTPGSWVVDPAGHRAIYTGRIMEDHVDRMGNLTHGVLRRHTVSFNLPPGVHCDPGVVVPPPSPEDEEDPSEELPVGGASSDSSSPTVAAAVDLGSGAVPVGPAVRTDAVIDQIVLDSDSDDDHGDT